MTQLRRRQKESVIQETLKRVPASSGGIAAQLDANGTTLDVDVITDGEVLMRVGGIITSIALGAPGAHATTHEPGGADAMAVNAAAGVGSLRTIGVTGVSAAAGNDARLSDARTPTAHKASHENGGADELSVAGLSGLLADPQTPVAHDASHENGGSDEINVAGLSGLLADPQTPDLTAHLADSDPHTQYQRESEKGAAGGYASLDGAGKLPQSQLPSIAITDTFVVANQAAMLALTAETGDVAVRTDLNQTFILDGTDPTVLADWTQLLTPTDTVISVNGETGAVSLVAADIPYSGSTGLSSADVESALDELDAEKAPLSHSHALGDLPASLITDTELATELANYADTDHSTTHEAGGSDAIKLDDLAATDDNTDLDASTAKHGLMMKYPGGTTTFLRADGAFAAPPGGAGSDPFVGSYAPGSFTLATGKYAVMSRRLALTGSQRATLEGTACLRIS